MAPSRSADAGEDGALPETVGPDVLDRDGGVQPFGEELQSMPREVQGPAEEAEDGQHDQRRSS